MKKCLKKLELKIYHVVKGEKIDGVHAGIRGDVDGAGLTDDERRSGVDVSQLIEDREEKENGFPK